MTERESTQPADAPPSLSLVVLCYRSGEEAADFVARTFLLFEDAGIEDFELVLVANYVEGSEDPTPAVVERLAAQHSNVRFSAKPKQGWLGWDVRCGLELARGRYICLIDGDGQMPISDVPQVYQRIRTEPYDLVKTFRLTRGDGLTRRLISNIYNKVFHLLFPGLLARDMNSKPKILTRAAYEKLELSADDWFIDAEIMIQARRYGFRIAEIPTGFLGLSSRRSFVGPKAVLEFVRNFARYRVREFRVPRSPR